MYDNATSEIEIPQTNIKSPQTALSQWIAGDDPGVPLTPIHRLACWDPMIEEGSVQPASAG